MDDFAGLSLGGSAQAPGAGSSSNGNDLLAGLSFSSPSTMPPSQQQQTPASFYQQYQTPLPAQLSAQQQASMSWGNLNTARPTGTSQSPQQQQHQMAARGPAAAPMTPASPAGNRPGSATSLQSQHQQGQRSTTPGVISLGMMGSMPSTPTASTAASSSSAAMPNYGGNGYGQQVQPPSQQQGGKPKDPFDDLLLL